MPHAEGGLNNEKITFYYRRCFIFPVWRDFCTFKRLQIEQMPGDAAGLLYGGFYMLGVLMAYLFLQMILLEDGEE